MTKLAFTKMNGAGNDFVVLDNRDGSLRLDAARIARLCDRHRGVGADGLLAVEPARGTADFRMRYYNSDGGEAEMCGNGARCFAKFAATLLDRPREDLRFETEAGEISAQLLPNGDVKLGMSAPHSFAEPVVLDLEGTPTEVHFLNTGVPHAVVFVEDLDATDVRKMGALLRYHPHFAPKGTNVNFVREEPGEGIAIRTYERGVEDETLACGTGVVACALLHHLRSGARSPVSVRVRGGDLLRVEFQPGPRGEFSSVFLQGPADLVYEGRIAFDEVADKDS